MSDLSACSMLLNVGERDDGQQDPTKYMRVPSAKPASLGVSKSRRATTMCSHPQQPSTATIHSNQQVQVAKPWSGRSHPITVEFSLSSCLIICVWGRK